MNPVLRWFHQLGSPPYFDRFAARWAPWGYGLGLLIMGVGIYLAIGAVLTLVALFMTRDTSDVDMEEFVE